MPKCRCLIADDEPLALRLLESYCNRLDNVEVVACCSSAAEALMTLRSGGIDVAVLDIQMPQLTGIEIARTVEDMPVEVIFVTAHRDYAFEGFKVHAADYLLKPVSFEEFRDSLTRVASRLQGGAPEYITVRSDYRQVRLDIGDILYAEGLKDYVKIYTVSRPRPVLTLMNLKALESMLPESHFVRLHRSYIAGLRYITSFDRSTAMVGEVQLPVGDTYRLRFIEKMNYER